jgi:hypothetical protein
LTNHSCIQFTYYIIASYYTHTNAKVSSVFAI